MSGGWAEAEAAWAKNQRGWYELMSSASARHALRAIEQSRSEEEVVQKTYEFVQIWPIDARRKLAMALGAPNEEFRSFRCNPWELQPVDCHMCGKNKAKFKCGKCGKVGYCDEECQKKHWKAGHCKRCY